MKLERVKAIINEEVKTSYNRTPNELEKALSNLNFNVPFVARKPRETYC